MFVTNDRFDRFVSEIRQEIAGIYKLQIVTLCALVGALVGLVAVLLFC